MRRAKHDRRSRQDHAEPQQLKLFRALPGDLAPRDAQDLMAYPFFSLAKSKRLAPMGAARSTAGASTSPISTPSPAVSYG